MPGLCIAVRCQRMLSNYTEQRNSAENVLKAQPSCVSGQESQPMGPQGAMPRERRVKTPCPRLAVAPIPSPQQTPAPRGEPHRGRLDFPALEGRQTKREHEKNLPDEQNS